MKKKYNVVIIGGGIAGALLAYKLSKNTTLSILVLEAGADRRAERIEMSLNYAAAKNKSPGSPYKNSQLTSLPFPDKTDTANPDYYRYETGSSAFKSTYLKIGGGSTWHWLGNVPRFLPNDFRLKSEYGRGFDWLVSYDDLEPFYGEAEREIGVAGNHEEWDGLYGAQRTEKFPMPEIWQTYSDQMLKPHLEGLDFDGLKVKVRSTPQARNSQIYQGRPACAGNSSCVPICPIGAKYDATVHLELAARNGVEVSYQSIVYDFEKDETGKISCVHYRNWENVKDIAEADVFVLAAHAIESAILLQATNTANSSGKVGKFLMDHPQGYGVALSNKPLFPFRGPPTTSGIDVFRDGEFRKHHSAFRISIGNDGWGRWKGQDKFEEILHSKTGGRLGNETLFLIGERLKKAVEDLGTRIFRFSFSTEMLPLESNFVMPSNDKDPRTDLPLPKINFSIDEETRYSQTAFTFASDVLKKMFSAIGVEGETQTTSEIKDFSGAGHIMGTTKMGADAFSSVVDGNCRTHDHQNLFLIGAGVFPTCGTANPSLTVAALSLRLADFIKNKFENYDFGGK